MQICEIANKFINFRYKLFNPYRHFGLKTMWPRGFPLDAIKVSPAEHEQYFEVEISEAQPL